MKKHLLFLLANLFLGCASENKQDEGNGDVNLIVEEVTLDSLSLEQFFADSTLKNISVAELNSLTQSLPDTSRFSGIKFDFIKLDSIKNAGGYRQYLENIDVGMAKDVRAVQFKTIDLGNERTLSLWGFDYATYEACPYSEIKVIFISSYVKDKNVSCIPFAYIENAADAPFYFTSSTTSKLAKNGDVEISETETEGSIDDNDKEYDTTQAIKLNYRFVKGSFVKE